MKVKVGDDLVALLTLAYRSRLAVMLRGGHGLGKSEVVTATAQSLGIECKTINLAAVEPVDLTGLPKQVKSTGTTSFCPPEFLPKSGNGFLFFDEMNRADRSVLAVTYQLISARRLNSSGYVLPEGYVCVAACNPDDEYDVQALDAAMVSRFLVADVEVSVPSWVQWGERNGLHPSVLEYVKRTENIFSGASSNPRAWKYASDALKTFEADGKGNPDTLLAAISGLVGSEHGFAFVHGYLGGEQPLNAEAVVSHYPRHKITLRRWVAERRLDLVQSTAHTVQVALQNSDLASKVSGDESMMQNINDFAEDLPPDMGNKVKRHAKSCGAIA